MKIEILNPVGEFIEYCDKQNFKLYFENDIRFKIQLEKIKQDIPLLKKFLNGKVLNSTTTKNSLKDLIQIFCIIYCLLVKMSISGIIF